MRLWSPEDLGHRWQSRRAQVLVAVILQELQLQLGERDRLVIRGPAGMGSLMFASFWSKRNTGIMSSGPGSGEILIILYLMVSVARRASAESVHRRTMALLLCLAGPGLMGVGGHRHAETACCPEPTEGRTIGQGENTEAVMSSCCVPRGQKDHQELVSADGRPCIQGHR